VREKILYINNRYRQYDRRKYRVLAGAFDLRVLWIVPPPRGEPVPPELTDAFTFEILEPGRADIIRPWQAARAVRLARAIDRLSRDVDLIVSSTSDSWKSKVAYLVARLRGKRIALRKERWIEKPIRGLGRSALNARVQQWLTRHIDRHADAMLPTGTAARSYLLRHGTREDRIHVFRSLPDDLGSYPPDPQVLSDLECLKTSAVTFLYLGRVMEQKGLRELIQAVRCRTRAGADVALWVVGEPIRTDEGRGAVSVRYFEECRALALGEPRIHFLGAVPPLAVHNYYRACDVFVHPHVLAVAGEEMHEGWGNVIVEAASMGKPIVTTDRVASAYDFVRDGHNGFVLDSRRLDPALDTALEFFLADPRRIAEFGAQSRRIFEELSDSAANIRAVRAALSTTGSVDGPAPDPRG
jgi:glycosyltransferase involved in cell wall biosynthesis